MSTQTVHSPRSKQLCILAVVSTLEIISIAAVTISDRVCTNNTTWLKRAGFSWFTLAEYYELVDHAPNRHLTAFQKHLTWDDLLKRDEGI